jgi:hypothetical protein
MTLKLSRPMPQWRIAPRPNSQDRFNAYMNSVSRFARTTRLLKRRGASGV